MALCLLLYHPPFRNVFVNFPLVYDTQSEAILKLHFTRNLTDYSKLIIDVFLTNQVLFKIALT